MVDRRSEPGSLLTGSVARAKPREHPASVCRTPAVAAREQSAGERTVWLKM
jgi:hypothetical protein